MTRVGVKTKRGLVAICMLDSALLVQPAKCRGIFRPFAARLQ